MSGCLLYLSASGNTGVDQSAIWLPKPFLLSPGYHSLVWLIKVQPVNPAALLLQDPVRSHRQAGLKVLVRLQGQGSQGQPLGPWALDVEQKSMKEVNDKLQGFAPSPEQSRGLACQSQSCQACNSSHAVQGPLQCSW